MINPKKLVEMTKKWQSMSSAGRRRNATAKGDAGLDINEACRTSVADKGHCIVYSIDRMRFMVPLAYLNCRIFGELFKISEEEFGLTSGPIVLPFDMIFMEYVMSLLQRQVSEEVERALVSSVSVARACTMSPVELDHHLAVCSF